MKKRIGILLLAVVLLSGMTLVFAANPGSDEDPLISKSYIDNVLMPQIYSYIDKAVGSSGTDRPTGETSAFEVVNISPGQRLTAGAGTELILRMGSGTIIGSMRGGISDTTDGVDLADGTPIPPNHLLIVPLADGRGLQLDNNGDAIVMVKGSYTLE